MVLFGHQSTTTVTFEEVMMMTKAVARGSKYGLRMVDMPYGSFWKSPQQAVDNAMKFVADGMGEVMKCEGNRYHAKNIEAIVRSGIPVQGHIGICPMRLPQLSGFRCQGRKADEALQLVDDAQAFIDAGCFSILNEVTSQEVTEYLGEKLSVPVISLGAGLGGDGVHIITSDLFNLADMCPRHSKVYKDLIPDMVAVMESYRDEVKAKQYPGPEHSNKMFRKRKQHDDLKEFAKALDWTTKLEQLEADEAAGKV
jgi:3-methyl-2-oxobutanoate hydroxymethyltransferase